MQIFTTQRRLVLTNEAARHPFRRSLPPPIIEPLSTQEPLSDRGLFVLIFVAAFLAFSTFLG